MVKMMDFEPSRVKVDLHCLYHEQVNTTIISSCIISVVWSFLETHDHDTQRPSLIRTRMQRSKSQNELNTDGLLDSGECRRLAKFTMVRQTWLIFSRLLSSIWFYVSTRLTLTDQPRFCSSNDVHYSNFLTASTVIDLCRCLTDVFSRLEKFNADFDELEQVTVV